MQTRITQNNYRIKYDIQLLRCSSRYLIEDVRTQANKAVKAIFMEQ